MSDVPSAPPSGSGAGSGAAPAPSSPASSPSPSAPAAAPGGQSGAPPSRAGPPQGATSLPKGATGAPTPAPAATTEPKSRKYQIKVDGGVREVDLSSMADEEVVKQLQLADAAQRRMQEAAEQRKKVSSLFEMLKKDPLTALKDPSIGVDVRKLVEDQILREYEESQLDEPTRKTKQLERDLQAREAQIKEYEQRQQQQAQMQLEERVFQETQQQFVEALKSESIPQTRESLYMMAEIAQLNLENGIELSPAQLAAEVKDRMGGIHTHMIKGLEGDKLVAYLGEDVVTKVLKYAVDRVKSQQNQQAFQPPVAADPEDDFRGPQHSQRRRQNLQEAKKYWRK